MRSYELRFSMLAPSRGVGHTAKLDAVFAVLELVDGFEDMSDLDAAGRFSVWVHVAAESPQDALAHGLEELTKADAEAGGMPLGEIIGVHIELDEADELSDARVPLVAAAG